MPKLFSFRIWLLWPVLLLAALASSAYANGNKEALLKAATIYRFSHFLQWPAPKNLKKDVPGTVNICVTGSKYTEDMRKVFDKASEKGLRTYKLLLSSDWSDIGTDCHILFVGMSKKGQIRSILSEVSTKPVLTVSDISGFADQGGIIEFSLIDNKLKVGVVNLPAAEKAGVHIGAELLEVAINVRNK